MVTQNDVNMKTISTNFMKKSKTALSVNYLWPVMFSLILVFPGLQSSAQQTTPEVTVRFANPEYDCENLTYCLDVEFIADVPHEELFGINVRFYYDDQVLEFIAFGDFQGGYGPFDPNPPEILPLESGGGQSSFGFLGDGVFLNGAIQLISAGNPIYLTTEWTKLFNVCFSVDPAYWGLEEFCPSIVWDLAANKDGGFADGSDGVVITLVDVARDLPSKPTNEDVVQFNWEYSENVGLPYGSPSPVPEICIDTVCEQVPLSNWALYTAVFLIMTFIAIRFKRLI